MLVLALLLVLIIGFYNCFNEAKTCMESTKNTGLTVLNVVQIFVKLAHF